MPPVTQRNARAKLDENMRICGTDPFSGTFSNEVTELVILTVGTAIIETTSELPTPTNAAAMPAKFDSALGQLLGYEPSESLPTPTQHPNSLPASYCCPG